MREVGPWQRKQRQKRQDNKGKSQQNDRKHGTIAEAVWRREAWCNAVCRSLTYKGAVRVQLLWCSRLREWGRRRDWGLGITRVILPCVRTPAKIIRHTIITRNNTETETQIWIQDQIWTVEYRRKAKEIAVFLNTQVWNWLCPPVHCLTLKLDKQKSKPSRFRCQSAIWKQKTITLASLCFI